MNRPTISSVVSALVIPVLAAALMAAAPVRAATMSYGTGLSSPAFTIDFTGQADGSTVDAAYSGLGVTFGGLYVTSVLGSTLPPTTAPAAANFQGGTTNAVFTIGFSKAVTDVAFFLYTDGFGTTITSSLAGATVETVGAGTYLSSGADFFGFTNSAFDLITVSVLGSGTAVIDNVQVGAVADVPEPGSALLLAGMAGMMAMRRRRS